MQFLKQHSSQYVPPGTQSLALFGHVWRIWVPGWSLKLSFKTRPDKVEGRTQKRSYGFDDLRNISKFQCKRLNPQDFPSSLLHLQRPLVSCVQDLRCSKLLSYKRLCHVSSETDIVPAGARWWRRLASASPVSPNGSSIELSSSFNQSSPPSFSSFKGKLTTTIITFVTFCPTEITSLNGLHCHQKINFYDHDSVQKAEQELWLRAVSLLSDSSFTTAFALGMFNCPSW